MRPHPREQIIHRAQSDLAKRVQEWLDENDLTTVEELAVINAVLSGTIGGTLKYCIRSERHDEVETPGGVEKASDEGGRHHRDD